MMQGNGAKSSTFCTITTTKNGTEWQKTDLPFRAQARMPFVATKICAPKNNPPQSFLRRVKRIVLNSQFRQWLSYIV